MSSKVKLLFCGTPEFAVPSLQALVADSDFDVAMVLSQPDRPSGRGQKLKPSPVKQYAQEKNIPVLTPESVNTAEVIEQLKQQDFSACVVVAFGQILKPQFLNLFQQKCVNLHGSLLPRWRGAAPIQRSLMAGDKQSGVCLQVVVQKLDAGPVIGERKVKVYDDINAQDLHDQLSALGPELFLKEFKQYLKGELQARDQDEALVTYAQKITKEETAIDWQLSAKVIHNKVRGLAMGPFAWSVCKNKKYKIHKTVAKDFTGKPGEVILLDKEQMLIACGEGALSVQEIQPESKNKLKIVEFLKGTQLQQGDRFESC